MNVRTKRIKQWRIVAIIAFVILGIGQFIEYQANLPEKQELTVYAPSDMQYAFEEALEMSELKANYKIVMSDNPNSNICVEYGKKADETYQKFAFSPFVVAYSTKSSCHNELEESGVLQESLYNQGGYEIDFLRVINEAIGDGKWENLGVEDQGELKVFYPEKESIYWNDFYDFLLVTLNDGRYPEDVSKIESIEEEINKFINSPYTEGVTDFNEQVRRTGGFNSNVIYILTEKEAIDIAKAQSKSVKLFYPTKTVYFNYYVKGDELGNQVIEAFDDTSFWNDFYEELSSAKYRNIKYSNLDGYCDYVEGKENAYNVVKIPEKKG